MHGDHDPSDHRSQRPGPALRALVIGDEPGAWRRAGFEVAADGTTAIGGVGIALVGGDDRGVLGWTLTGPAPEPGPGAREVEPRFLDGIATALSDEPAIGPVPHPNGVTAIDHVVVRSPDLPRTVAELERWGLEARRVRDVPDADPPRRQVFLWAGPVILELVGPTAAPTGDGPAAIWGLALVADDIDGTARFLGPALSKPRDAVQPGRRIAGIRTNDLDISVPLAVMSPHHTP